MITYRFSSAQGSKPLYVQLCAMLREDIQSGRIPSNSKLPSKRAFAVQLGVSQITVETAYAQLQAEGWIRSVPKSGFYVIPLAAIPAAAIKNSRKEIPLQNPERSPSATSAQIQPSATCKEVLDLSGRSAMAELFPFTVWARTIRRILSVDREALLAASPGAGVLELREAIARHLREFRGMEVSAGQVFVAAGAETLYGILARTIGRDAGWAVENPGYGKIAAIYRQYGCKVLPVDVDESGMEPNALRESGASVAHLSPSHQFPTGAVARATRRYEWLEWASEAENRIIVEDDYDSELRQTGRPLPTLHGMDAEGRVVYLNTLSRTMAPSLRVGYMVLPERLLPAFAKTFEPLACSVPTLTQYALASFISEGYFERHLSRLRTHFGKVREELVAALRNDKIAGETSFSETGAGLHLLLSLKGRRKAAKVAETAKKAGLLVTPLETFYDGTPPPASLSKLVINYASLPLGKAHEAAELLWRAIKS